MATDVVVGKATLVSDGNRVVTGRRRIGAAFLLAAAVAPSTVITVPKGSLTLAGTPPSLNVANVNASTRTIAEVIYRPQFVQTQRKQILAFLNAASPTPAIFVNPPSANLSFTGFAPQVTVEEYVPFLGPDDGWWPDTYWEPTPIAKRLGAILTNTASITITPPPIALTVNGFAPVLSISNSPTIGPPTATMTLTGFVPTVVNTANTLVQPSSLSMTISGLAPTVVQTAGALISVPRGTLTMGLGTVAPSNSTSPSILVNTLGLSMTGYAPSVLTTLQTFRVQATQAGEYNSEYYDIGDVFDVDVREFADANIDYSAGYPASGEYGWMKIVPANTPLVNSGQTIRNKPRRTVF